MTDDERQEIDAAALELGTDASSLARDAIAELLADFRERQVFERHQRDRVLSGQNSDLSGH